MKLVKERYKLVLKEPKKDEKILWVGSKKECRKKKLEFSFTYNKDWLVVIETEAKSREIGPDFSISGVLGFFVVAGLVYLSWINGKKIHITD